MRRNRESSTISVDTVIDGALYVQGAHVFLVDYDDWNNILSEYVGCGSDTCYDGLPTNAMYFA